MSDAEQSARCAECGKELAPGAPEGLCPACLLIRGLETQSGAGPAARFTPPEPEELAGHFPQLEILELLGRGGMGMVYKARQKNLDRLVALKILAAPAERDPAFAERFAREAVALARLSHPHIVAVYDLGRADGGLYYLLMEYVDGVNVRQLLNNAQITPDEALAIVPQVCEALQYAHEQGIVHRDIKPENILIDRTGRVKIADFGLAKIVGREAGVTLTSSGATMGTPAYMAPEQIERPQEVDHRADVYSVGVVFYQMLTGELPMGRFAPPSKKVQIDVRLDEVILRALEKEPDLRWQQAGDVKTEVETIMSTPPPAAPGAQPVHAPGKGSGGPMKILVGALVLIAALVAAFVYEQDHKSAPNWAGGTLVTPPPPPPATTPAPAQPEATPSAAPAPQEQQDTVALLLSGKWNIMGKVDHETWYVAEFRPDRSVLVTKANGTQETREWTMDGSVISIIYSNHHDIFYPPLDPAGTSGQGRTQGFTATRIKDTEEGLLFSGAWQFTGMNVSATRVFNSDGSFTTNGDATASGKWWAETDKIVMAFRDGHTETMELPLNSKGTAGTDRDGNAMIASLAGNAATPPSPGAGGDEDIALLMAGRWYFFGASWSAIRTFYENGTFASEPRAEETGKWKRRDGAIDLLFDNGNRDAFLLPMDAKGTLGVDTHGFPCIAYLLGPAPAARPGATPSPAPTTANIPEETTTSLLVSGPWRMWGKNWSARRTFRSDGSFFSDNDSSSARGKWKITGGSVELSFEDGHKDILQLPLNPAGTRGVGGADSLGYVAFLVDSKGINPVSQVVAPGTPQEAATIKLLTSGQWVVRSETGGTGYLLRTLNADGTFSDHAANVDPD
ncbi:MAG TPA: serine/threonine-protein kinase, partial [Chthoniobacteraceae bacterium]|nr:serine/threonine-protein kinase [Chthoniobacteraceae bacterium]